MESLVTLVMFTYCFTHFICIYCVLVKAILFNYCTYTILSYIIFRYTTYSIHLLSTMSIHPITYIHYMTKSMWTPACRTSHSRIMGINMDLVPPFADITASTLLGSLSTRCWNIAAGSCFNSATRALVRSGTDVVRLGLACSQRSNSSQRFSMGLRVGLCAGQSSSTTLISTNHFFMGLTLCTGAQSWKHRIIKNVIVCCSVNISLHWN